MSGENENLGAAAGDSSVVIDNREAEQQNGNSNLSADSAFGSNLQVGSNQAYQTIDRWVIKYIWSISSFSWKNSQSNEYSNFSSFHPIDRNNYKSRNVALFSISRFSFKILIKKSRWSGQLSLAFGGYFLFNFFLVFKIVEKGEMKKNSDRNLGLTEVNFEDNSILNSDIHHRRQRKLTTTSSVLE